MRRWRRVFSATVTIALALLVTALARAEGRAFVGAAVVDVGQQLAAPPPGSPYLSSSVGRALTASTSASSTTPSASTWDPAVVAAIAALARSSGSRGLVLAHGDEIVVDVTPEGRGPFAVASISKAITALAVARAVDEGAVSFDDAVADTVVDWRNDARRDVRLRALLSHTSGLSGDLSTVTTPGLPAYHLRAYDVVPAIVEARVGVDFAAFVDDHLLRPAGGNGIVWHKDGDGNVNAGAGARVSVDDLLVLGRLVLGGGFAPGGEVLRARTLDELLHAHGLYARNHAMGWWLQHPSDNALQWDIVEARGGSGHMVSVVPGKQAVLVRIGSAGNDSGIPEQFHALLRRL